MDPDRPSRESPSSSAGSLAAEDRELVDGCLRGDRSVQRRLYDRYADRVYAVVLKMTGNREEAVDLSQDIFIRIFEKIGEFRGESALGTWIYRIAVNTTLHHLRSVRRGRAATDRVRERASPYAETPDPDLTMDLDVILADLSDDERAILLLRYQQDLSYAEIAQVLKIPMGTIASRLNRAREQMRQRMASYANNPARGRIAKEGPEESP
jgi:RNA polymerase sigma-70 factor, ECF subfamily